MSPALHTTLSLKLAAPALIASVVLASGCEPEVGQPCGAPDVVDQRVRQEPGSSDLVQDLAFENCKQGLCASVDASRPFCTIRCETELDCQADGFECRPLVYFGRLACREWTPEDDCPQADGTPSETPYKYCAPPLETGRALISKRDCDWGRETEETICTQAEQCLAGDAVACESEGGEEAP